MREENTTKANKFIFNAFVFLVVEKDADDEEALEMFGADWRCICRTCEKHSNENASDVVDEMDRNVRLNNDYYYEDEHLLDAETEEYSKSF